MAWFTQPNNESRARLAEVAERISADGFAKKTPDGWTVASLFAHMAFWERRMLVLARRWKAEGMDESPIDSTMTNDAMQPLCLAIEPPVAVQLCLEAAAATDAELESMSPDLIQAIEESGNHFRFDRGLHRNDHLNQIEKTLAGG
jgi:Mycothiol maleylpyruvate isomerase N-terminal domain